MDKYGKLDFDCIENLIAYFEDTVRELKELLDQNNIEVPKELQKNVDIIIN